MFTFAHLYASVLSNFRAVWHPFRVVFSFIYHSFLGLKFFGNDTGTPQSSTLPTFNSDNAKALNDLPTQPPNVEIIEIRRYCPPGVIKIIGRGGGNFIGLVDESTVLKYPCIPGDNETIKVEAELLATLGDHPRIVTSKGLTENGLKLQYARNGNLYERITSRHNISLDQKLRWCKQAAEAVKYIHEKRVIHCDINLRNFLLDDNLNLLLADFQGMLKSHDGKTLLDGLSREGSKSFMPRTHGDFADVKTDIFALGSAIYFIMTGHEVFPELNSFEDDEKIELRFRNEDFPTDDYMWSNITNKCWRQLYESAENIILDISQIQASSSCTETEDGIIMIGS